MLRMTWCGLSAILLAAMVGGCTNSSETAEKDKLTEHVGVYPPPAAPAQFTCGVPQFKIAYSDPDAKKLESLAADQATSLMFQTRRFDMVERAQMDKALAEQNMEGIVDPKEMAKAGKMSGARFLVAGKVTNLRVKAEKSEHGLGIAKVTGLFNAGGFDYKKKDSTIKVECGIDLRIFDSTTGKILAAHFGEYTRTDTIGSVGIEILGANATADADLKIDQDNKGKILRLAIDECIRKMLPDIDSSLAKVSAATPAKTVDTPKTITTPATPPVAAKKFCGQCGKEIAPAAKFCGSCGAKCE